MHTTGGAFLILSLVELFRPGLVLKTTNTQRFGKWGNSTRTQALPTITQTIELTPNEIDQNHFPAQHVALWTTNLKFVGSSPA